MRIPYWSITPSASVELDSLRGLSAVAVLIGHLRGLFLVEYGQVTNPDWMAFLVYFVTGFGHQAVVVFFVLSGFLITGTILRALASNRWSWEDYLGKRLARLLVVLLPALLITALLDYVGINWGGNRMLYLEPLPHFGETSVVDRHGIDVLFGNMLFLQKTYVPPFGSDSPLWTLACEFWYYMLFPLLLLTAIKANGQSIVRRLVYGILAACIGYFIMGAMWEGFFIWMMGASVHLMPAWTRICNERVWRLVVLSTGSIVFLVLALTRSHKLKGWEDIVLGVACTLLIYVLVHKPTPPSVYKEPASMLASFSYSLYAIHFPFILCMAAVIGHRGLLPYSKELILRGCITTVVMCMIAYWFSRVTEANTERVRYWTIRACHKVMRSGAPPA